MSFVHMSTDLEYSICCFSFKTVLQDILTFSERSFLEGEIINNEVLVEVEWMEALEVRRILYRIPCFTFCRNSLPSV